MSKQMTSPIESIPLHHVDNRGICLREPTALAVLILVISFVFPIVMSFGCLFCLYLFFGWHDEERNTSLIC
jgi:hypothetical protein